LPGNELVLFVASFAVNLVISAILFVVFGGLKLNQAAAAVAVPAVVDGPSGATAPEVAHPLTVKIGATLTSLVALVVGALVFDLDVGLTAITLAVLLAIVWPEISKKAAVRSPCPPCC
jgi:hypothetical protein